MSLRELTEDELKCIEHYAGLLFSLYDIADILEVERVDFINAYKDNDQKIQSLYKKGSLLAQAKLREKLLSLAFDGSNTAITEVLKLLAEFDKNNAKI